MSAMIQTPTAWSFPDARFSRMASVEELDTNLNNLTRLSRRFSIRGGEGSENGSPTSAARPMPMTPPGTPSVARSPEEGDKFEYDAPASPPVRTSIPPNTPVTPAAAAAFCSASRGQGEGSSSSAVSAIGGANVVAIDNKIEQAMDLVKTHLTFAVREEVEILRSTIVDLEARVAGLEQQNQYLRQFVPAEVLANLAIISRQPTAGTPTHATPSIAPLPAPKTVPSGTFCPATATLASTLNTVVAEGKSPKMNH